MTNQEDKMFSCNIIHIPFLTMKHHGCDWTLLRLHLQLQYHSFEKQFNSAVVSLFMYACTFSASVGAHELTVLHF